MVSLGGTSGETTPPGWYDGSGGACTSCVPIASTNGVWDSAGQAGTEIGLYWPVWVAGIIIVIVLFIVVARYA